MTTQSKLYFKNIENCTCKELLHPWTNSCILAILAFACTAFKNASFLFFPPIYLIQICLKGRSITREYLKRHFKAYLYSSAFGTLYGTSFMAFYCLTRNIVGKNKIYTSGWIPPFITGLTILLEHESRREFVIATVVNATLEYILRYLESERNMKRTLAMDTAIFMTLSGLVMCLLRKYPLKKPHKMTHLWFYTPLPLKKRAVEAHRIQLNPSKIPNGSRKNHICSHIGSCWNNMLKSLGKYFSIGVGLQMLRLFLPHNRNRISLKGAINAAIKDKRTLLFGAFLGGYVALYEIIHCILCQYRGRDSEFHSLVAGFCAGSAYCLQPNKTILLSALTTVLQVVAMQAASRKLIPNTPIMGAILFGVCHVILVSTRFVHPHLSPRLIVSIQSLGSNGLTDKIVERYFEIVSRPPSDSLVGKSM